MSKQTYWISDPNTGTRALVEGAEERDRWTKVHGWTLATEPAPRDRVWLHHPDSGGRTAMAKEAADGFWKGLGWEPSAPPEPVDLTKDTALVDPGVTAARASTGDQPAEKSASATGGKDTKEASRG